LYANQGIPMGLDDFQTTTVATDSGISGGLRHWLVFGVRGRWYGSER
jgi:hypothetical protein